MINLPFAFHSRLNYPFVSPAASLLWSRYSPCRASPSHEAVCPKWPTDLRDGFSFSLFCLFSLNLHSGGTTSIIWTYIHPQISWKNRPSRCELLEWHFSELLPKAAFLGPIQRGFFCVLLFFFAKPQPLLVLGWPRTVHPIFITGSWVVGWLHT